METSFAIYFQLTSSSAARRLPCAWRSDNLTCPAAAHFRCKLLRCVERVFIATSTRWDHMYTWKVTDVSKVSVGCCMMGGVGRVGMEEEFVVHTTKDEHRGKIQFTSLFSVIIKRCPDPRMLLKNTFPLNTQCCSAEPHFILQPRVVSRLKHSE